MPAIDFDNDWDNYEPPREDEEMPDPVYFASDVRRMMDEAMERTDLNERLELLVEAVRMADRVIRDFHDENDTHDGVDSEADSAKNHEFTARNLIVKTRAEIEEEKYCLYLGINSEFIDPQTDPLMNFTARGPVIVKHRMMDSRDGPYRNTDASRLRSGAQWAKYDKHHEYGRVFKSPSPNAAVRTRDRKGMYREETCLEAHEANLPDDVVDRYNFMIRSELRALMAHGYSLHEAEKLIAKPIPEQTVYLWITEVFDEVNDRLDEAERRLYDFVSYLEDFKSLQDDEFIDPRDAIVNGASIRELEHIFESTMCVRDLDDRRKYLLEMYDTLIESETWYDLTDPRPLFSFMDKIHDQLYGSRS